MVSMFISSQTATLMSRAASLALLAMISIRPIIELSAENEGRVVKEVIAKEAMAKDLETGPVATGGN